MVVHFAQFGHPGCSPEGYKEQEQNPYVASKIFLKCINGLNFRVFFLDTAPSSPTSSICGESDLGGGIHRAPEIDALGNYISICIL